MKSLINSANILSIRNGTWIRPSHNNGFNRQRPLDSLFRKTELIINEQRPEKIYSLSNMTLDFGSKCQRMVYDQAIREDYSGDSSNL